MNRWSRSQGAIPSFSSLPISNCGPLISVSGRAFVWNGFRYNLLANPSGGYKRFVVIGDSISAEAPSGGWPHYFSLLSNGEYICTYNDSISNTNLTQMDARFSAIPSWVKADIIAVQGGTNNPGVNIANKTSIQNLVSKIYDRGAVPQLHAIPPQLNMNISADWNFWLANYSAKNSIEFIDKWPGLADPATGGIAAAYARDSTHPNPAGQVVAAQRFLDIMRAKNGASSQWLYPLQFANTTGGIGFSANPLNTLDSDTNGNGDGWGAPSLLGSQSPIPCVSVTTRTNAVFPAIGRPQRFQDSFNYRTQNSLVRHSKDIYGQGARAGHRIHVVSHLKLNALTEEAGFPNSVFVGATLGTNGLSSYNPPECKFNAVGISGIHVREMVLPPSFTELYLSWRSWGGDGSTDYEVGNVHIYDLTEQGLD